MYKFKITHNILNAVVLKSTLKSRKKFAQDIPDFPLVNTYTRLGTNIHRKHVWTPRATVR